MDLPGLTVFAVAYAGIALGGLPGLAIDRAGVALLGAMLMIVTRTLSIEQATASIDGSTLILLFGLMLLSAQFRLGGFYSHLAVLIVRRPLPPAKFLAWLIAVSAGLSALLSNDVICLALAPLVVEITRGRGWRPVPFLLSLAAASNIGSAATIIGNPQNMFIGQRAALAFDVFLLWCAPPAILSLAALWMWGVWRSPLGDHSEPPHPLSLHTARPYDAWQTRKGLVLLGLLVGLFFTPVPREITVLGVASILLMSRRLTSGQFLSLVDWPLLILFVGLFILIEGFRACGGLDASLDLLDRAGIDLFEPLTFSAVSVVLSNLISNVPAVMLLMSDWSHGETELAYLLALTSTFAGNFLLIGSIANLIVAEQAARMGTGVSFRAHFVWTAPVAATSLVIGVAWWLLVRTWGLS